MEAFQIAIDSYQCNSSIKKRVMFSGPASWFPALMWILSFAFLWWAILSDLVDGGPLWHGGRGEPGRFSFARCLGRAGWPVVKEEFLLFQSQDALLPWWPYHGVSSLCSLRPQGSLPTIAAPFPWFRSEFRVVGGHFWEGKGTFPVLKKNGFDCVRNRYISLSFSHDKSTRDTHHDRCWQGKQKAFKY